jgi:hypothetical protein
MHPPSVQLLRSMRTSLAASNRALIPPHAALLQPLLTPAPICSHLSSSNKYYSNDSRNSNSGSGSHASRPPRIVHRTQPPKPQTHDRGPPSSEKTQTDFTELNVLGNIPTPATAVDACLDDGFHLDNGVKVTGGDGVLLVGGEAFRWRPWEASRRGDVGDAKHQQRHHQELRRNMVNEKGQFEVPEEVWGLLSLVWPRPGVFSTFSTVPPVL